MRCSPLLRALSLVVSLFAVLFVTRAARAQALTLASSSPGEGEVVAPPTKITLTFSAPIEAKGMTAWITDADGTPNANALCPQVTGRVSGATATLVAPPNALHAGLRVVVMWTAQPKGGSAPQSGKLAFTISKAPTLVGSTPTAAAALDSPPESIALSFDQPIATGASIAVTVQQGAAAPRRIAASVAVRGADEKTITVLLQDAPAGSYEVTWTVKNSLGMATRGMVRFTAR